jgi:adenylate kinase family enzyme
MRVAVVGNSGSGKSTLARLLGTEGAAMLDLDTVAWEPGKIAVARPVDRAVADVREFCATHGNWVIEGCYANLIGAALAFDPVLVFLDPGVEQCLANCRARPWEAHKYRSQEEQDARLAFLLSWVEQYYTRDGDMSHAAHAALFDAYAGSKRRLDRLPDAATIVRLAVFDRTATP